MPKIQIGGTRRRKKSRDLDALRKWETDAEAALEWIAEEAASFRREAEEDTLTNLLAKHFEATEDKPFTLDTEQARAYGFKIPDTWKVKAYGELTDKGGGSSQVSARFSEITPTGWEIDADLNVLSPSGEQYNLEDIKTWEDADKTATGLLGRYWRQWENEWKGMAPPSEEKQPYLWREWIKTETDAIPDAISEETVDMARAEPTGIIWDSEKELYVPATLDLQVTRDFYTRFPELLPEGISPALTFDEFDALIAEQSLKMEQFNESMLAVFPELLSSIPKDQHDNITSAFVNEVIVNPEVQDIFTNTVLEIGRTAETELLLKTFNLSDSDIDEFFGIPSDAEIIETPQSVVRPEPEWENALTGEIITQSEIDKRFPKGSEIGLDEWRLTAETGRNYWNVFKIFGEGLTKLPKQLAASVATAVQSFGGASVVNKDWADNLVKEANTDLNKFVQDTIDQYGGMRLPINVDDIAMLPQNMAFSLTSMGAGLVTGGPIALLPVPYARAAAWGVGSIASGAAAFNMASYQIMQQYLELKNEEMKGTADRELTLEEENTLKRDFAGLATKYGLWEAVPEAISNLAFAKLLTLPLGKMIGKNMASQVLQKVAGMYGQELLTETITQKGQSAVEIEAGLREGEITWVEAFKEIAPQTFLLTTVLGGAGSISVAAVSRIKKSLKQEISEEPLFKEINNNITEDVFAEVEAHAAEVEVAAEPIVTPTEPGVTPTPPKGVEGEAFLYHVTPTEYVEGIKEHGLVPMARPSNWVKAGDKTRYGKGEIYTFENQTDAARFAASMDWEVNGEMGSGKISIVRLKRTGDWTIDTNDPIMQAGRKGNWLKTMIGVKAEDIDVSVPLTNEVTKQLTRLDPEVNLFGIPTPEVTPTPQSVTPEADEISQVTQTDRAAGAVGAKAITPRHVGQTSSKGETILDFGSGKVPIHTDVLREQGFNVTPYDIGKNVVEGVHDVNALTKTYDTVFASNVINVAPSKAFLRKTLGEISGSVKEGGRAVFNYPVDPRKLKLSNAEMEAIIKEFFPSVTKVGGTAQAPIWEASGVTPTPVTEPVVAPEVTPSVEAAPAQPVAEAGEPSTLDPSALQDIQPFSVEEIQATFNVDADVAVAIDFIAREAALDLSKVKLSSQPTRAEDALWQLAPKYQAMLEANRANEPIVQEALATQKLMDNEPTLWKLNPTKRWFEANAEYVYSVDPDLLCQRSEGTDAAVHYLKQLLGQRYTKDMGWEVITRANEQDLQTPCPQCFVFSGRTKTGTSHQKKYLVGLGGYSGEIIRLDQTTIDRLGDEGWNLLRHFSSADFKVEHTAGMVMEFMDAANRGLAVGGYSKQGDVARIFGDANFYVNLSVGRNIQIGMDMNEAIALRNKYDSVGIIYVPFHNDEMLEALRNSNVDHVIGWHTSGQQIKELATKVSGKIVNYQTERLPALKGDPRQKGAPPHLRVKVSEAKGDVETYVRLTEERGLVKPYNTIYDLLGDNEKHLYMKLVGVEYGKFGQQMPFKLPDPSKVNFDFIPEAIKNRKVSLAATDSDFIKIAKQMVSEVQAGTFTRGDATPLVEQGSLVLQQDTRGSTEFLKDGTAIIRGLESADVSTGIHEIAHVIRRQLVNRDVPATGRKLTTEQIELVEKWAGAKNGKWTTTAEEKFAKGFERYLRDGKAPNKKLEAVFAQFKQWLTSIYRNLRKSKMDIKISTEMRQVFDKILGAEAVTQPAEVVAPEREIVAEGGVPVSPDALVPQGVVDNIGVIKDIGIKEKGRTSRKVFERMGLPVLARSLQVAEVLVLEEKIQGSKELRKIFGSIDKKKWSIIFRKADSGESLTGLLWEEKRAVNHVRKWADVWADRKNLPREKRIKNYIPHLFEQEMIDQLKRGEDIAPELALMLEERTKSGITDPFLKKRLGAVGFIEDPVRAMEAYEAAALRVIYYEPLLQKISAIANDSKQPKSVRDWLKEYSRRLTDEPSTMDKESNTTILEGAEIIRKLPGIGSWLADRMSQGNPMAALSNNLAGLYYFLWMGGKPTTAIRNLSQHILIMGEVGPKYFAEGIALRFTEEGRKAVNEKSYTWRGRKSAKSAATVPGFEDSMIRGKTKKVVDAALYAFNKADEQNVKNGFLSGYAEAKDLLTKANNELPEGDRLSQEELYDYLVWRGDEVANDTQYLYTKLNAMSVSRSGLGKVFSILTTWTSNWLELMIKWVSKRPSIAYQQFEKRTGGKVAVKNWSSTYKSIILYMVILGLTYALKERERIKAWEYTGITSLRYLADIAGGDFPGLEIPGAVANIVAGITTDDSRRLKTGWDSLMRTLHPSVIQQITKVTSGERDWLTLLFYLEGKDFYIKQLENKWEKGWEEYESLGLPEDTSSMTDEEIAKFGRIASKERNKYRKANPQIEAQMFVASKFTTLSSDEARAEVLRIIEKNELDTELIDGYEKVFGVDTNKKFIKVKKSLGTVELEDTGEQKLKENGELDYYTTSNFASYVNEQENIVGRYKIEKDGNLLAVEYLKAKDSFVQFDNLTTGDARTLFRQQFPDVEAQLYLWGRIASFKNPNSATILLGLMEKYNIPPESIPAFLDKPERYDEIFSKKFEIQQKSFELDAEYEGFGLETSPNYISRDETIRVDGEEVSSRKYARAQFKEEHLDWWADQKRIEAIDNEVPDKLDGMNGIDAWAERCTNAIEYGVNSPQDKVWYLDHPETYKWAIENNLREDTIRDWNEPVLRIDNEFAEQDDVYDEIDSDAVNPKTRLSLRLEYLLENEEYRKARRRRDALKWDGADKEIISSHVEYGERFLNDDTGSSSAAKLWRSNNTAYETFRTGIPEGDPGHLKELDLENRPVWQIDVGYAKEEAEYEAIDPDTRNPSTGVLHRTEWLQKPENDEYRKARHRRKGYKLNNSKTGYEFPDTLVEDYVSFMELGAKGKRQERMLLEGYDAATGTYSPFAQALYDVGKKSDLPLPGEVPAVQYDDIYDRYPERFDRLEGAGNSESIYFIEQGDKDPRTGRTPREQTVHDLRFNRDGKLSNLGIAEIRRDGYAIFMPEEYIERYVDWGILEKEGTPDDWPTTRNNEPHIWYEDDWYYIEHPKFYEVLKGVMRKDDANWHMDRDKEYWSEIPSREVFDLYVQYEKLSTGKLREDFRFEHRDLEAWGQKKFGWESITEKRRRATLSPSERTEEWVRRMEGLLE